MTEHRLSGPVPEDLLAGEAALARLYRSAAREMPSPGVDQTIAAAARVSARASVIKRWVVPLSIAAIVVVTVSVVLRLSEQPAFEPLEPPRGASEARSPAVPAPAAPKSKQPDSATRDPSLAAAPSADARLAESFAGRRDDAARTAPSADASASDADAREKAAAAQMSRAAQLAPSIALPREEAAARARARRDSADDSQKPALLAQGAEAKRAGAEIVAVNVSGKPGAYEFDVTVRSPDTGCAQYADWWEVLSTDGRLLYRRVLDHSHADEQPFARSGGPVPIARDAIVWIRVHMNNSGYGSIGLKGSVAGGFTRTPIAPDFAVSLQKQRPLPEGCAF